MDDAETLLSEVEAYCRRAGLAESTFGRRAVNDGKFVRRVRAGGGVTPKTAKRARAFMAKHAGTAEESAAASGLTRSRPRRAPKDEPGAAFRFYDNRQKYLLFVTTCGEKWVVADRVGMELSHLSPRPPALRLFDAGMGDGTVLTRVMRQLHRRFPTMPWFIVGKEISYEDVRLSLEKMPDRFYEHPATVLVVTNLYYTEAPWLMPRSVNAAAMLNWQEVPLAGTTPHEFDEQIRALQPGLSECWRVRASPKTGNPLYTRPSVLVIYRDDHRFLLDGIVPRPGQTDGNYDLIVASQPYRARMPVEFKVERVLAPLARALAPGGRMLAIHSHGHDPGLEIVQRVWPGEEPFQTNRHELLKALKQALGGAARNLNFNAYSDKRALFRYDMHTLPTEIGSTIGTSTLLAAWNAAIYVAQIDDQRLDAVIGSRGYLEATAAVLREHNALWFMDESFVVSRRGG